MQLIEQDEQEIREFLTRMHKWFARTGEPDIRFVKGSNCTIVEIKLGNEVVGGFIGRNGVIISAIRSLLESYGKRRSHTIHTQLIEPAKRQRTNRVSNGE